MEEKLDYSEIPYEYPQCLNWQCPKAGTCLRQLAAQCTPDDVKYCVIVSPKFMATQSGDCSFYRSNVKVRYAQGFIGILEGLSYKQMQTAVSSLMRYFSRRTYYRIRKGERALSPAEQEGILNIIRNCGATGAQEFDAYFDNYDW